MPPLPIPPVGLYQLTSLPSVRGLSRQGGFQNRGWGRLRANPDPAPPTTLSTPEPLDVDTTPGTLDATAPIWLLPSEDPAATPPTHSVPVPATELGSTELVTTKTTGPELQ